MPTKTTKQAMTLHCVYTIVDSTKLARYLSKPYKDIQGRLWVTAHTLWQRGLEADQRMPILFGDANDCNTLLCWGFVKDLHLDRTAQTTTFVVDKLRYISGTHSTQKLILKSTGQPIAPNFIRPYAICRKPDFIDE